MASDSTLSPLASTSLLPDKTVLQSGEAYTRPSSTQPQAHINMSQYVIKQSFSSDHDSDIQVVHCYEPDIDSHLPAFLETLKGTPIGLTPTYDTRCRIKSLALASQTQVLVVALLSKDIRFPCKKKARKEAKVTSLQVLLNDPTILKAAFRMDKISAALFYDHHITISYAKDLLSAAKGHRHSLAALLNVLAGYAPLNRKTVINLFRNDESDVNEPKITALQAWAAYYSTSLPHMDLRLGSIGSIDTSLYDGRIISFIAKRINIMNQITNLKPARMNHEFNSDLSNEMGNLSISSERYKTRLLRTASNQNVEVTFELEVETVGRDFPHPAEMLKADFLLRTLQNPEFLSTHPFVEMIWFPPWKRLCRVSPDTETVSPDLCLDRVLNESQKKATEAILSSNPVHRIVLIHGPPGTGKTTVIVAAVTTAMASPDKNATMWLVAQSNVAVKNMAEKLASVGFLDFKILVAKDFHFDWHEHIYEKVSHNIINSDEFPEDIVQAERALLGFRVVLCTVSMLSSRRLAPVARLVPLKTVVFDEASQIEIGDYLPMMLQFRSTICKMVFIGDDKQLAPHSSQEIRGMESIFEMHHLCQEALFLDTQYRMPLAIASCISANVYKGLLKSQDLVSDHFCCRFIDVATGSEQFQRSSWINAREADVVIKIARQLVDQKKSFRIITPYDAQRSLVESSLQQAGLPWENKCFNIDSFQGNEDDYIVVSIVRTQKLGFLNDLRRVNVMLTRCKKGMIICTNRGFIEGPGGTSLIAKLAASLGDSTWMTVENLDAHDGIQLLK